MQERAPSMVRSIQPSLVGSEYGVRGLARSGVLPVVAVAQQSAGRPRIGVLWESSPRILQRPFHEAFRQGVRDIGYVEKFPTS